MRSSTSYPPSTIASQGRVQRLLLGLGQEPDPAQVHPEQRHPARPGHLRGPQQRAVAAQHQHHLGALGAARPAVDDARLQPVGQVAVGHLGPLLGEHPQPDAGRGQPTGDGGRGAPVGGPADVQDQQTSRVIASLGGPSSHRDGAASPVADVLAVPRRAAGSTRRCRTARAAGWPPRRAAQPSARAAAATSPSAASRSPGSRTTPPAPEPLRPTSNCGLTIGSSSPSGRGARGSAGSTVRSEMNDRSATTSSTGPPMSSGVSVRTLVRSSTRTRSSLRSRQTSCP